MAARLTACTVDFKGAPALAPRRQKALILANALIPRGTLAFDHNGRAMQAAPLDITKSVALGGPFKVAGTTVDGDLYFYSSLGRPMSVSLVNGAALAISTAAAGSVVITIVSGTESELRKLRDLVISKPLSQEYPIRAILKGTNCKLAQYSIDLSPSETKSAADNKLMNLKKLQSLPQRQSVSLG